MAGDNEGKDVRLVRGAGRKEGRTKERGGGCDSQAGVPPCRLTLETGAVRTNAKTKSEYSAPSNLYYHPADSRAFENLKEGEVSGLRHTRPWTR